MPHHIRILAGRLDRGAGSHVYNNQLIRRLAARGHTVSTVCFDADPDVRNCADVLEISSPASYHDAPIVWRLFAWRAYGYCRRRLLQAALARPDIVVAAEHFFMTAHARRFPETPLLYLPHSLLVDEEIKSYELPPSAHVVTNYLYVRLQKWGLRHATRTVRFTQQACDAMRARYGAQIRSPFFVNPMGTDIPELGTGSENMGVVRLLWVGQLIARKRIDVALSVLATLTEARWQFDIVGKGDQREALEKQANDLGLQDRVVFHGFQERPDRWYRQADLLLFPSWLENSPVTMLEAMSYGVPCLAMRGDGVRFHNANAEIIRDGEDGFLANDDDHFSRLLAGLLANPTPLKAAGDAARMAIINRHTWDHHIQRYERLFDQLVADRKSERLRG
jgi:glycosyltransferase involved in cell wall biosynthesis